MKSTAKSGAASSTIIDVANEAGVSMKTVSRVINREPNVAAQTRDRVLEAINRLGYQRNVFARGLRAERSLFLGLMYQNPKGDYPAGVLHGALAQCRRHGYHLAVEVLDGDDIMKHAERFLTQTRLDGVLTTPPICDNEKILATLAQFNVPYVRISPYQPHADERFIGIDDRAAAREVMSYLMSIGHSRIGFIGGIPGHAATKERLGGYRDGLEAAGIAIDKALITDGNFDFMSGVEGAQKLLSLSEPPTAIFASNDEAAAGVLSYAHEHGVSVPDDLSVCGFDGGTISNVVWPRLTTVMQPIRRLGEQAVEALIEAEQDRAQTGREKNQAAAGNARETGPIILPHNLVIGGSTAAI